MSLSIDVIQKLNSALNDPTIGNALSKAITQSTGLVWYDLEPVAKLLYPVITPLRNKIPRVPGDGGTATHWKGITAINTANLSAGVSEGNRNAGLSTTVRDYVASYKALGFEDNVSFEADYAAKNFDDVKSLAVMGLLRSLMIAEEKTILWGNGSVAFGTTPTPAATSAAGSGTLLKNTQYDLVAVALSAEGYFNAAIATGIPQQISRVNVNGDTDTFGGGAAKKSAIGSVTTPDVGTNNYCVSASVTSVPGAAGYAWFYGVTAQPLLLSAITTVNKVTITGGEVQGTQAVTDLASTDYSVNSLLFDGVLTQIADPLSGSYVKSLDGLTLTSDGAGGIVEINNAFRSFWDNYRLSPNEIWMSAQEIGNVNTKVIAAGGAPLIRYQMDVSGASVENMKFSAGAIVGDIINRYSMDGGTSAKIRLHPNMPAGTMLFWSDTIPYPLSNVRNLLQMKMRRDYYQIEWPLRTRKYEYGIYMDGLLQGYFWPAFGVIQNIANG
jgi:hypothetical protein